MSDRLKHKKHYLSFLRPHGFWLDLTDVEALVRSGQRRLPKSKAHYEALLREPLYAHTSSGARREFTNMPRLKEHLERAWVDGVTKSAEEAGARSTASKRSRSRSSGREGEEAPQGQRRRQSSSASETASERD